MDVRRWPDHGMDHRDERGDDGAVMRQWIRPAPKPARVSGDDVRGQSVFQFGDLVAQDQFLALEAGDLQLIGKGRQAQGVDRVVQILVLLTKLGDAHQEGVVVRRKLVVVKHV